jgi:GMP synthase-like glutamine amidotransferase
VRFLIVQHDYDTPLGSLGEPLASHGEIDTWLPKDEPAPPGPVGAYSGVVILGGTTHPDQDEQFPWLQPEVAVVREALERRVPTLGVCLGGQLVARAAGGWIGPAETSEVGWYPIRIDPAAAADPVLGGLVDGFHAFEWHHYRFEPPPGAVPLAWTEAACQAYRLGEHAWGLQFHIEVDAAIVASWLDDPYGVADLLEHGFDGAAIREASARHEAEYVRTATDLGERFARTARALRRD